MRDGVPQSSRAVVIGGSIAGLLTARVLSEVFDAVTVVDRDRLPIAGIPRQGVPQSAQPHVLFTRGYRILQALFPGIGKDLEAAGAIPIDWGKEFNYFQQGGWNATCEDDSGLVSFTCTRPLLEATIRRRVADLPNVHWRENTRVSGLIGDRHQVRGIRHRQPGHVHDSEVFADLVVDASGRSSRGPQWLEALGAIAPPVTVVDPYLGYATQRLRIPEHCQADWKVLLVSQVAPDNPRLGYLAQVEGGEWIATLGGYGKHYPPLDQAGFMNFARQLASPAFYQAIQAAEPVTPITAHRATANRLYHYDRAEMPRGFAAIGDAVCALCPVYGQGMTVSALSALVLRDWLKSHQHTLNALDMTGFQRQLAKTLQFPWNVAVGSDSQFPTTAGALTNRSPVASLFQAYIGRLLRKSTDDAWIHVRFTEIAHMLKPPTALLSPRLLLKALVD